MQRDRREPATEPDTLAGEAVAADLQQLTGEIDELAQVGCADAVVTGGRSGAGRRTDPQHLPRR